MKLYDPAYLGLNVVKSMGDELLVFCPYHFDSNPSAEYNLEKGLFYCFGCHETKTAKQLSEDLGGTLVVMGSIPDEYLKRPGGDLEWVNLLKNSWAVGNKYLEDRGVSKWQVIKHDIRTSSAGIIFPLKDKFGQIKGVQIRHFKDKPKYKFYGQRTPLWPMEDLLLESLRKKHNLFITEGIFGALRINRFYSDNGGMAFAIMGSSSIKKAAKILKLIGNKRLYSVMDNDWAGQVAAGKFILLGIPAMIWPNSWRDSPDEFKITEWIKINHNIEKYSTTDVMDIVERSDDPEKLQMILEKFYRRIK